MSLDLSLILMIFAALLLICTVIRGGMAWRGTEQEALTIDEGLETIKRRFVARDYLQAAMVIVLVSLLIGGLYGFLWVSPGWVSFAHALLLALLCVSCGFMIRTWLRRSSIDQIVQLVSHDASTEEVTPRGHLHRLLRTYRYYNETEKKPALFDWIRRQLGLYILGLDIGAHIPFSFKQIARFTGLLTLSILLIATLLNFTIKFTSPIGTKFSEDPMASEIDKEKEDGEKASAEGEKIASEEVEETREIIPQDPTQEEQPENMASTESASSSSGNEAGGSEGEGQATTGEESVPEPSEENMPQTPEDNNQTGEGWLADLMDKVRDFLPGEDEVPGQGDGENSEPAPSEVAGLSPDGENEANTSGDKATESSGSGQQSSEQAQSSPENKSLTRGESLPATSDMPSELSSDQGAGDSDRARISRGGGPKIQGQATAVQTDVKEDAIAMQINVDQETTEAPGHESNQPLRPNRYNPALTLKPEDVSITPADPLLTQRIPRSYERTIKRLLSKP